MNFGKIKDILKVAAEDKGISEYEIFYSDGIDISAQTLKDEISSFSNGVQSGVCFRCVYMGHMGSSSTELLDEQELVSLVERAIDNAQIIDTAEDAIIFDGSSEYAAIDKPDFTMPDVATVKDLAQSIQKKTYESCEFIVDGTQSGVFAQTNNIELVNSKGLELSCSMNVCGAYVEAVISRDGEAQESFDFTLGFEDAHALSESVSKKAMAKLGACEIPSGKYKIIISGEQMRDVLATFFSVFSGKSAYLGLSLFGNKVGEQVASECITVTDDPMLNGSPIQINFDGEGVATYRKNVIENGILKTLLYDLSSAQKAGKTSTGNGQRFSYAQPVGIGPFSFYINGGQKSTEELMKIMGDGIYITELKGLHAGANPATGDFSIESEGFMVRHGKLAEAVRGFTVAGNFYELLRLVKDISCDVKFGMPSGFSNFGCPDVLFDEISVAGK